MSLSPCELVAALESGALMLVANKRQATSWRAAYDAWQAEQVHKVWLDADILPLSSWLAKLWLHHGGGSVAAGDMEEAGWWRKAIREDGQLTGIVHVRGLAEEAMDAAHMLSAYGHGRTDIPDGMDEQSEELMRWMARVESWLGEHGKLMRGHLWASVIGEIEAGHLPVPAQLFLAGFVEETPAMQALLEAMTGRGSRLERLALPAAASERKLWRLTDANAEARFLAGRIREIYRPGMRIGVAVPRLAERQLVLANVLEEELNPQGRLLPAQPVVDLSLGRPLSSHPMIRSAMLILSWIGEDEADFSLLSAILRLPQACGDESDRLVLELAARKEGGRKLPVSTWLNWSECANRPEVHNWLLRLHRMDAKKRQPPSAWLGDLEAWLNECSWPGEMPQGGMPVLREWREVLAGLTALDAPLGALDWRGVRAELFAALDRHIFRPEPGSDAVRVMGLLESAGQSFDHLFVIGMHEGAWPQSPRPNALIPVEVQRRLGLPHADAEREYRYAEAVWEQLLAAAPSIEVMYATYDPREGERNPSPLVMDWESFSATDVESQRPAINLSRLGAGKEVIASPRIPLDDLRAVRGGSAILQYQSDCPFKAFAAHRLKLAGMDEPLVGMDAAGRGSIVHESLAAFWGEVSTKRELMALAAGQRLEATVRHHVEQAVSRRAPFWLDRNRRELECRAVGELILNWLQQEMKRLPFVVKDREELKQLNVAGLGLRVRLDRVDEDEAGRRIILDYKTGTVSPAKWQGERPADTQLPLYSLNGPVDAVAFALIRADGFRFNGIACEADVLPGVKAIEDWQGQLQDWQEALEALAREFMGGDTRANPRDDDACRYCKFAPFCRINEEEPDA